MDLEQWSRRFAAAGLAGRAALLGGTAIRLTARLIDEGVERAATVYVEAERAFKRELDPNMEDAKILGERSDEKRRS